MIVFTFCGHPLVVKKNSCILVVYVGSGMEDEINLRIVKVRTQTLIQLVAATWNAHFNGFKMSDECYHGIFEFMQVVIL